MADNCVCHINGYRVKDTEARRMATNGAQMANAAMEKATSYEKQIAEAVTTANKATITADRVNVTAKAAYNTATAAAAAAAEADKIAKEALPKSGGTMTGDLNMNGREISNAMNIQTRAVILKEPGTGFDVSMEAMTEPGVVHLFCAKNMTTGANKDGSIVVRGVSAPVHGFDAVNKQYLEEIISALREEFFNMNATTMKIAATATDVNANHIVSGVVLNMKTELVEEEE